MESLSIGFSGKGFHRLLTVMKPMTDLLFELEAILKSHAKRYPLMQPRDAVKLIYQNEFGGGHLIQDEHACLNHLRQEYADLVKDPTAPLYEDIGNGIVRVNLAALKEEDLEQLGQDFIASAAKHKGMLESFLNKLKVLETLTEEGVFTFDTNTLTAYLSEYKAAGYPAVSHSEQYRQAYKPSYRIILMLSI